MTSQEEATSRNTVLAEKHGKIPSYALWREMDIDDETLETRIEWWKTYTKDSEIYVKTVANYWTKILNDKLKESDNKKTNSVVFIEDHNCCTKRGYGNDLYCDI